MRARAAARLFAVTIVAAAALCGQELPAASRRKPALDPSACPCGTGKTCTGKRGGSYCITSKGGKRYGRR